MGYPSENVFSKPLAKLGSTGRRAGSLSASPSPALPARDAAALRAHLDSPRVEVSFSVVRAHMGVQAVQPATLPCCHNSVLIASSSTHREASVLACSLVALLTSDALDVGVHARVGIADLYTRNSLKHASRRKAAGCANLALSCSCPARRQHLLYAHMVCMPPPAPSRLTGRSRGSPGPTLDETPGPAPMYRTSRTGLPRYSLSHSAASSPSSRAVPAHSQHVTFIVRTGSSDAGSSSTCRRTACRL